jgi:hypothetical protein
MGKELLTELKADIYHNVLMKVYSQYTYIKEVEVNNPYVQYMKM